MPCAPVWSPTFGSPCRVPVAEPASQQQTSRTPSTDRRSQLDATVTFAKRHIGPAVEDQDKMLALLGHASLEELVDAAVPASIRGGEPLRLDRGRSEHEVLEELRALAAQNQVVTSMIGLGYHGTVTPPVIVRNVLESPAWYTAYTPYQPEISQGRLEALLNFQTVVTDLTGLPVAGASLLDEATAAAEAMTLARRSSKAAAGAVFVVDTDVLPQTLAVVQTRAEPLGIDGRRPRRARGRAARRATSSACWCSIRARPVSSPTCRRSPRPAHERGAIVTAAADLLALTLLKPPGEMGADIVVGTTQRFGVPVGFGGPHAGYMSVRSGLERSLPGRLVGVSKDVDGAPAYRLALQTREQHIRREKATSNICTAQVLLAVIAGMYAVYHGPEGLAAIARRVHRYAVVLAAGLRSFDEPAAGHRRGRSRRLLRHRARRASPVAPTRSSPRRWPTASTSVASTPTTSRSRPIETTTRDHLAAVWSAFSDGGETADADDARRDAPTTCSRRRCTGSRRTSRTRSSTRTGPRRRCCATCVASPTRTSRSTGR